ncbi:MAG: sugar ABC transporter permease [Dermatophilaceae bacterium]
MSAHEPTTGGVQDGAGTETALEAPAADVESPEALPADLQDERLIASQGMRGWFSASMARMRSGDLGSLPVIIGLVLIWAIFQALNPAFLSAGNLVNLTLQSAAVGTIAVGVVLVLLLGEIDLSVGSMSGLAAAILAVTFVNQEWPPAVAVLVTLATGAVVGLFYGFVYNRFGVPSFVITLSGLLALLGMQLLVLGKLGTINVAFTSVIVQFANGRFLPPWLSYLLAVLTAALYLVTRIRVNRQRSAAGLSTMPVGALLLRAVLLAGLMLLVAGVLNRDRGVSYMVLTFLVLVVLMDLAIRRTRWGRSVMAVGGNVEAARRAGINVNRIYLSVFTLCATFAALGGVFLAARGASASQSTGGADTNLNAIASAVIGGTSLFGGRGSAYSALLGILVIQSISNGLDLLSVESAVRYMVTGAVLLLAVVIDSLSRRSRAAHGRA